MKKLNKYYMLIASLAVCFSTFTSCHDDIYHLINEEVRLEEKGIFGDITTGTRFSKDGKTQLFIANGKVFAKDITKDSTEDFNSTGLYNEHWKKVINPEDQNSPFYSKEVNFLAADANYIYALATSWKENLNGNNVIVKREIFYSQNGTEWTLIPSAVFGYDESDFFNCVLIFSNEALTPADLNDGSNRNAYIKLIGSKLASDYAPENKSASIFKLNGSATPVEIPKDTNNCSSSTCKAVYFKGQDYFFNYTSAAAGPDYIYFNSKNETVVHYANKWTKEKGYYISGNDKDGEAAQDKGAILTLAVTKDYLLMGTTSGIQHTVLSADGQPNAGTAKFSTNASTSLSASYYVFNIFVRDPSMEEEKTDLYGTTTIHGSLSSTSISGLFKECGLWAYYPSRGTWNKDGTADTKTFPAGN